MDPGVTISIIALVIVVAIAWKEFGGKQDLERVRRRFRRGEPED